MSRRLRDTFRVCLVAVAACLLPLHVLLAYDMPLKPADVHDAYVLGRRNDQATATFLNPYIKELTAGASHPDVTQIEVLTPFAQVVDLSRRNATTNYTEQQAADDYRQHGDKIIVQITLMLPAAYANAARNHSQEATPQTENSAALAPENFWQNFRFNLMQHGKIIATRSIHNQPIRSTATKDTPSVLDGATVWLEYDAKDVAPEVATLEVLTPDAKTVRAMFDLDKLR